MSITTGTRLGRYEVRSQLGAGGMGEVYLAHDTKLDRPVALKLLPASFTTDEDRLRRFEQEAKAASALNHPNIITIYEIDETDSAHFIASEFVDGMTLRERMTNDPLALGEMLDIAVQVASALSAAHAAGIVHRDIKPDNIMLRRDGYVKVLDFGLAKLVERNAAATIDGEAPTRVMVNTDPGMVMGTAHYMSPEQARGASVDARTDIWSLGCVLYEMATGRPPFEGQTASDVIASVLKTEPPPLVRFARDVPAELERIVSKALEKDREERYQTVKDLYIDLRRLKKRLEVESELERSTPPDRIRSEAMPTLSSAPTIITKPDASGDTVEQTAIVARTEGVEAGRPTSSAEYIVSNIRRHKRGAIVAAMIAVALGASLAFGLYKFFSGNQPEQPSTPVRVTPLTTFSGVERSPAFSPDGRQIAFVWTGEGDDINFDIYVKIVDAGTPLRLTTNPERDISPVWSPDGRYVAFLRAEGEGKGFYLVPALGGAERRLAESFGSRGQTIPSQRLDWSPDGRWLAVVDRNFENEPWSIFLLSIETGERRRLTEPLTFGDLHVAFSPDGQTLAFTRSIDGTAGDIYLMPVAGGEPRRLTFDDATIQSLAWTRDGRHLVFSSARAGNPTLWRIPATGGAPALIAGIGEGAVDVSISRQGDHLAYAQLSLDVDISRVELTSQANGRRSAGSPTILISSTRQEEAAEFSPDGQRIAFRSNRSGNDEIWVCRSDGSNPVQLTNFGGPFTAAPRWSPDGRWIVFYSRASGNFDVYIISAEGGSPRRLTTDPSGEISASWSRDGRWIYFSSRRSGRGEVWRMPATGGGDAVQVTRNGGWNARESPDGRTLYYTKTQNGEPSLWRMSLESGEETQALETRVRERDWAVTERGIYFIPFQTSSPYTIEFFDFATRQTTRLATLEGQRGVFVATLLAVSPDERWLLYTQRTRLEYDLMLVENFR
jgi:eukaryotic-like serine/threonine-protein kinase